jgi:hypothetical protein
LVIVSSYLIKNSVNAQPPLNENTNMEIKDTGTLERFEGYYQFQEDTTVYLQITANRNILTLKQLWDGKEINFEQKSDVDFYNQEQSFPLKFTKASNGDIIQVLAFDKDAWKKVNDYKPVIKKEIHLTEQQLKTFEGKYTFQFEKGEDSYLQITATADHLILKQLWDSKEINFVPESTESFFCKEQSFPLKFIKDSKGNVIQLLAFNRDLWEKVK